MENKNIIFLKRFFRWFKKPALIVFGLYLILLPILSQAATMGVQALLTQVSPGQTFSIRVSINTQGKVINNAEAVVNFPSDLVQVVSVSSNGIFSLWVEPPSFSNSSGVISFNGGVPNPGFTGTGQILSAVFKAKKAGTAKFSLSSAAIRENDGLGTNILSGQGGGSIVILEQIEKPKEEAKTPDKEPDQPIERVTITSPTHPDTTLWYKETKASFNWRLPSGATASQTSFDQNPGGVPSVIRRPAINSLAIDSVGEGVWYFHARFLVKQTWSPVYSYKIQVDTTPPDNLNVVTKTDAENRLSAVMTATDKDSGVAYYTVQIDSQLPVTVPATVNETVALLPPLSKDKHILTVIVYDKAGNSTSKQVDFENVEGEKITITHYEKEIKDNDHITVTGLAPADSVLRVSLSTQNGLIRYYYIKSEPTGDFIFTSEPIAGGGVYTLWVERESKEGGASLSSERIEIAVKDSFWSKVRNWFVDLGKLITWNNITMLGLFLFGLLGWFKFFILRRQFSRGSSKKSAVKSLGEAISKKIKK